MTSVKRAIPVPVEKALKAFYAYLTDVKEDIVCRTSSRKTETSDEIRNKKIKLLDEFKAVSEALLNNLNLELPENSKEQELMSLVQIARAQAEEDVDAAHCKWTDPLLKGATEILDSFLHVNLEKLTAILEKNDAAGVVMEGKDVVLLLGSAGSGKSTTLHYLAGTAFEEVEVNGKPHFEPVDIVIPENESVKTSYGSQGAVVTRTLQTVEVDLDGQAVVVCDTPSFGYHETIENVIANNLGLVRALKKAKTIRPLLVLNHEEMSIGERFIAYPQILAILNRLMGVNAKVDWECFNCIFTKYNTKNRQKVREQIMQFKREVESDDNESAKNSVIRYLIKHSLEPEERVVVPTKGSPEVFLTNLLQTPPIGNPQLSFTSKVSEKIMSQLKCQLKFTLLNLRSSLTYDDNKTAIYRMGQMSKLANVLPEAGIYARHGFKAFKEIIHKMVEEDKDDEYGADTEFSPTVSHDLSEGSLTSTESEQRGNLTSKLSKPSKLSKSSNVASNIKLSPVSEELEEPQGTIVPPDEDRQDSSGIMNDLCDLCEEEAIEVEELIDVEEIEVEAEADQQLQCEAFKDISASCDTGNVATHLRQSYSNDLHSQANRSAVSEKHYPVHQIDSEGQNLETPPSDDSSQSRLTQAIHWFRKNTPKINSILSTTSSENERNAQVHRYLPTNMSGISSISASSASHQSESPSGCNKSEGDSESQIEDSSQNESETKSAVSTESKLEIVNNDGSKAETNQRPGKRSSYLRKLVMLAVENKNQRRVLLLMQDFCAAVKNNPEEAAEHRQFNQCVELFMRFSVALQETNYPKTISAMKRLIALGKILPEAKKCSQFGLDATIKHIVKLRDDVVDMTSRLHRIVDPDEFDRTLELLHVERQKVDESDALIQMCMKECNDRGKSETILACLSYGFEMGNNAR